MYSVDVKNFFKFEYFFVIYVIFIVKNVLNQFLMEMFQIDIDFLVFIIENVIFVMWINFDK